MRVNTVSNRAYSARDRSSSRPQGKPLSHPCKPSYIPHCGYLREFPWTSFLSSCSTCRKQECGCWLVMCARLRGRVIWDGRTASGQPASPNGLLHERDVISDMQMLTTARQTLKVYGEYQSSSGNTATIKRTSGPPMEPPEPPVTSNDL